VTNQILKNLATFKLKIVDKNSVHPISANGRLNVKIPSPKNKNTMVSAR
jgi:hypothetical protein